MKTFLVAYYIAKLLCVAAHERRTRKSKPITVSVHICQLLEGVDGCVKVQRQEVTQ